MIAHTALFLGLMVALPAHALDPCKFTKVVEDKLAEPPLLKVQTGAG